jgi:hypothetical protein
MQFANPNSSEVRPPMTWWRLGETIALGGPPYHKWREAPWQTFAISDGDESPRVRAYQLVEKPYVELLDNAVELWLREKPLPTLDETASYLLGLRFQVVGNLLMSFDSVGVLMPPAPDDEIGISRQFLIDWWHKNGAFYAVGSECAELRGAV